MGLGMAGVAESGAGGVGGSALEMNGEGADEKEQEEKTSTATDSNTDDAAVAEWANEIEMQRILDEMIVLTGLAGEGSGMEMDASGLTATSPTTGAEYTNPELSLGLDLGLGMDMGFNMDFTSPGGWDVDASMGGVGVF